MRKSEKYKKLSGSNNIYNIMCKSENFEVPNKFISRQPFRSVDER